jgi:hypothetical protein
MAEAVNESTQVAPEAPADAVPAEQASPEPPRKRLPGSEERTHRGKFRAVYAFLALVLVAGVAGLVFLLVGTDSEPDVAWSAWQPTSDSPDEQTQEIAGHVAGFYRLDGERQLVTVQAGPLQVQDIPVAFVAIRTAPPGAAPVGTDIPIFDGNSTVVYILCGLGQDCAIEDGEPSRERQRLLRREALELALYTFRYVEGKDYVVAFLPPRPGVRASYAMFFQRSDLDQALDQPLAATLPSDPPPLPEQISPSETATIDELTMPRFFAFRFQQLQDGTGVLVLDDPEQAPPPETIEEQTDPSGAQQPQQTTTQPADEASQ